MSKLNDCAGKMRLLLDEVDRTEAAYRKALNLLQALDTNQQVDLSGLGMKLTFDDHTEVPVPMSGNPAALAETVAGSVNFLGNETGRLWTEIYMVATEAKQHFDDAVQRAHAQAQAQQTAAPPQPQMPTQQPQLPVPGQPQPPMGGVPAGNAPAPAVGPSRPQGQAPTVPKLNPVQTTDVTHEKR